MEELKEDIFEQRLAAPVPRVHPPSPRESGCLGSGPALLGTHLKKAVAKRPPQGLPFPSEPLLG